MSIPQSALYAAITVARDLESRGYFERVRQGDQRAASYFARLVAYEGNKWGAGDSFGWLSKTHGESQVDGYAEDAIVYGDNPGELENVIDLVNGAGAPGASIGGAVKPRRENNRWVKPQALSVEQMRYLNPAYDPAPTPVPTPTPQPPSNELAPIKAQLEALTNVVGSLVVAITELHNDNADIKNKVSDVRKALSNGLAIDAQGKIPFAGSVSLKGSAKG